MPNNRDRERAKRRFAKREVSQAARADRRRRNQQVIGAVVTVLLVVGGVLALSSMVGDRATPAGAASTPAAAPTKDTATKDPATKDASNPCPAPTSTPVATPPTFKQAPPKSLAQGKVWDAKVVTTCGTIGLELYGDKAPQTVSSFIFLSRNGFYAGSPCHRVTSSQALKVLQCGDPTGQGTGGPGYSYSVENAPAGGAYPAGTLAMARSNAIDSNGSQFFLTYGDSTLPTEGGGYSVFGKVTSGLEVLTTVAEGGTTNGQPDGAPARAISIESITVTPR